MSEKKEKITYEEWRAMKKDDPVGWHRARREGRVTGMPPELSRRLARSNVSASRGSPLERAERFVREGVALAEQRKRDEQKQEG